MPYLVYYDTVAEYKKHYKTLYCDNDIYMSCGIKIDFMPSLFEHAFFESTKGVKDNLFSPSRAQRINWIKPTITDTNTQIFWGHNKKYKYSTPNSIVFVLQAPFVVVVDIKRKDGVLSGKFKTCYYATGSIRKIISKKQWSIEDLTI